MVWVSWDPAPADWEGPVTYFLYQSETPGGHDFGDPLGWIADPATSYGDGTVVGGRTYYYIVRAADRRGRMDTNLSELAVYVEDLEPPVWESYSGRHTTGCEVELRFEASDSCGEVDGYSVYRGASPGAPPDMGVPLATDVTSPFFDCVPRDGTWRYRLEAKDLAGNTSRSGEMPVPVTGCPPEAEPKFVRGSFLRSDPDVYGTFLGDPRAVSHRVCRGRLGSFDSCEADLGPDRVLHTDDDRGDCRTAGAAFRDPGVADDGESWFYLVVGLDPCSGEQGAYGWGSRSDGAPRPDAGVSCGP
jgi:hypothetical protein